MNRSFLHRQIESFKILVWIQRCAWMGAVLALASSSLRAEENPVPSIRVPKDNAVATVLETKAICREPGRYLGDGSEYVVDANMHPVIGKRVIEADRYIGWPTLTHTRDGTLIVAFSGDRDAHVCPWGKTQIVRSSDQGRTWSPPQTITSTPLDDRDAGITETQRGTLLVTWFASMAFNSRAYPTAYERYARHAEKITPEEKEKWLGNWTRRSEDGGKTWLDPVRNTVSAPHGAIQLRDGRLLYVGTGRDSHGLQPIQAEQSSDDGRSWTVIAALQKPADHAGNPGEPHVVELASGKLIAMARNEPKDRTRCFLLQSESEDGGKTWSTLHSSGIWGYPPHLVQLNNGWLLVTYGYRREPYGERACISRDEGRTWDIQNEIVLNDTGISADLGYPSSTQLADGSILTVYYQAERAGETTCLMSTHWHLK